MADVPDWNHGLAWNTVKLGGVVCPGVVTVECDVPSALDIKKAKGSKKATITDTGDPLIEFDLQVVMTTKEQVTEFFAKVWPILRPRTKSGGREPLAIEHPMAALLQVSAVVVGQVKPHPPKSMDGFIIDIKATEWTDAPTKVKPKSGAASPTDKAKDKEGWEKIAGNGSIADNGIPIMDGLLREPIARSFY